MFKAVKRLAVSAALKSFAGRLAVITSLHKSGKLSDLEYQQQRQQVLFEYSKFLADTPDDLVPDWAKQIG